MTFNEPMKLLRFKKDYNHHYEYQSDIDRIVQVFAERGYEISESDAVLAWEKYSDSMCAGWMSLGEDDEVFYDCFSYFEEV
jgi:hypothetical protein